MKSMAVGLLDRYLDHRFSYSKKRLVDVFVTLCFICSYNHGTSHRIQIKKSYLHCQPDIVNFVSIESSAFLSLQNCFIFWLNLSICLYKGNGYASYMY